MVDAVLVQIAQVAITMIAVVFGVFFASRWMRHQATEQALQREELNLQRQEIRQQRRDGIGPGEGGYIVVEMPERQRPLFHDLLKGFEDYAKLKGYNLSFSIDSSFDARIGFKFTIKDSGVIVAPDRVRKDFREYVDQVVNGDLNRLDDLPVVATPEEHSLLVTMLKNRIVFLQHSYALSQNALAFYERMMSALPQFPMLPSPNVVVQTGGTLDSRSYTAHQSQRLIQGDQGRYDDSSVNINIGRSLIERQERVAAVDALIARLDAVEGRTSEVDKTVRQLVKVKDELAEQAEPDISAVQRWLEYAKNGLKTAALGADVNTAAQKLFELFNLSL